MGFAGELQQGLRLHDTLPSNTKLWDQLLEHYDNLLIATIATGKILLKKQENAEACAFTTALDGFRVIAVNRGLTNSQIFKTVYDPLLHDIMIKFVWRKNNWSVSVYSDKKRINAGDICRKYGGGGHKSAAGFQCKQLPFKLN